jgi:hypothetical protein
MPYWELVTRSFRIAWDHKYLWLIALFAGEGGGGLNYSYNQGTRSTGGTQGGPPPSFASMQEQVTTWIADHIALLVAIAIVWLVLIVAFFILGAVCEGATVRASAEHDAERPFHLGWAWRSGVATMWTMVRFRLLILALVLPVFVLGFGYVAATIASFASGNRGLGAGLIALGVLVVPVAVVYVIYLVFLDRFGARAVVLEQLMARPALARAHRLLRKRLGRSLLVWLLAVAIGIGVAIVTACFFVIVGVPFLVIGLGMAAAGSTPLQLLPLIIVAAVVLLGLSLVISGFLSAQASTYWTVAFRRLDLDYAPAYPQFAPQQPPQAPGTPPQAPPT